MSGARYIELEGGRVHNLKNISLKIRHNALTVICGVSGSGKSSLAFDTLYAEGQRRYVETFSPSARQFLDRIERPAADRLVGLPPAIAIRQQMRADGARNTLGTRSEILDSLRVLFARVGDQYCPDCDICIESTSPETAARRVIEQCLDSRIMIAAAVDLATDKLTNDKLTSDEQRQRIASLIQQGYTRAVLAQASVRLDAVDPESVAEPLLIVIDRLKADPASSARLAEAIAVAMNLSDGTCVVLAEQSQQPSYRSGEQMLIDGANWSVRRFSKRRICSSCSREFADLSPESLSFTSPLGACTHCEGTGLTVRSNKVGKQKAAPEEVVCSACGGRRLNSNAIAVRWAHQNLPQVCAKEIGELVPWLHENYGMLDESLQSALKPVFEHALRRLSFLEENGLSYLSLDRSMKSLSGGESQRVMLTTALGSGLINTLYVLDEPTTGLHSTDTDRIIASVRALQQSGNTVVVVEHDPKFILAADEVVEIGPGAGDEGGDVVFQGTPEELLTANSQTAEKLREFQLRSRENEPSIPEKKTGARKKSSAASAGQAAGVASGAQASAVAGRKIRVPEEWLTFRNVNCHNIKDLNVRLPLGVFCAITGVSGSGKSSLISDSIFPAICRELKIPCEPSADGTIGSIEGVSQIDNVLLLDQSPVQRSRRSIPATWIGVFDDIRVLLAETHEAKKRNYSRAMFSFNAASGGRCPVCEGRGVVTVAMQFLADIATVCEECNGRRFRPDVIEIRYRDRSVFDILNMTADEAFTFFNGHHRIQQRLNAVRQTGLGYLRLGQPLSTISGGEAQRLRIAAMLAGVPLSDADHSAENRKSAQLTRSGRTLFLLDEPSSGLHMQDIDRLLNCIDFLLQTGHSVIVIDHDELLTSQADWQIEMGPGPGRHGGQIVRSSAAKV